MRAVPKCAQALEIPRLVDVDPSDRRLGNGIVAGGG